MRIVEQSARRRPLCGIVEQRGIAALELPGLEERRPVDVAREVGEIGPFERARPEVGRRRGAVGAPVNLERIRAGLNPSLAIEGVVLTMFDERTNLAQQVMNELKNFFGEKLCKTTVPRNIRLAEAPSHGKAALVYDPRSKGAESYIRLAKEIIERQPAFSPQESAVSDEAVAVATEEHADAAEAAPVAESQAQAEQPTEHSNVEEISAPGEMDKTA